MGWGQNSPRVLTGGLGGGFLHRRTNSRRRGKPTTTLSKRRKRKARRRGKRDGAGRCARGLAAPCRPSPRGENPPLRCWDRNAELQRFPSINTPPALPFPRLPRLLGCRCPGRGISGTRTLLCAGASSASRPTGVASEEEEEAEEGSGLRQVSGVRSVCGRGAEPPWQSGSCPACRGLRWLGTRHGAVTQPRGPWQGEPVLCLARAALQRRPLCF